MGASINVRPEVAEFNSVSFGPSSNHWSVTGAGLNAKDTNWFLGVREIFSAFQFLIFFGLIESSFNNSKYLNCG